MSLNGFTILQRSLLDWEWYEDTNVVRVFLHGCLKANYCDTTWRGKLIKRGQFISTPARIATELSLSVKQVRLAIDKMESTGDWASEGCSQHTVYTVIKWLDEQPKGEQKDKPREDSGASKGQADGQAKGEQGASERANESTPQVTDKANDLPDSEQPEGKQKASEGQTKGKRAGRKRATDKEKNNKRIKDKELCTPFPEDLTLSDHWRQLAENYWLRKNVTYLDAETEFLKFVSNNKSKPKESADWQANWTTWYVNAIQFSKPKGAHHATGQYQQNQQSGYPQGQPAANGYGEQESSWFDERDINEVNDLLGEPSPRFN